MTSEDDFRHAIDADPEDWQTLLVFSDFLRDRDDPRADGYAALARLRKCPTADTFGEGGKAGWAGTWFRWACAGLANRGGGNVVKEVEPEGLPSDWYDLVKGANELPDWNPTAWAYIRTRFEALDAAATGFARLPAERKAALLTGPTESVATER